MEIGDLVVSSVWHGYRQVLRNSNEPVKYGVIVDIRANGQLAFIRWTDGTTGLLDDAWFKVISNDREHKKK